jgi:hypothetical protein
VRRLLEVLAALPSCDVPAFRVLPLSCDAGFLRKLPATCVTFRLHSSFNYLKNTLCLFPAGRPIHPLNLRFVCASPASPAAETAFNGLLPSPPWRSPCGFRCGSLLIAPLRKPVWRGCIKSGDNQSFNQQKPGVLSHSCERSLARGDFLRKLSGTYEPSDLRPFCYNIQKNTQHLLVARIARIAPPLLNPDPSVARTLRPDRFSLQFN